MSTEKPPSIAPERPVTAPGTPARAAAVPTTTTSPAEDAARGTSVSDRLKKAAGSVGGAGRESPARAGQADAPRVDARPAGDRPAAAASGPRRVRLSVSRIDPWSVMKLSFLLSVAIGIMIVVAAAVIWQTLNQMAVFTQVNDVIATLSGSTTFFDVLDYASFSRVISLATMVAVIDVVLLTALSTIMAFLYNVVAALVGGLHLTLTDD
jgi:hypothetical protein